MKTLQIISRHETLSDAVKASGMDLSYNPEVAASRIAEAESGFRGWKSGEAFVTDEGVYFVFFADIKLLNKFHPFHGCINDDPFRMVDITKDEIFILDREIAKTPDNRKKIASMGLVVTSH